MQKQTTPAYTITLSPSAGVWSLFSRRKSDPGFTSFAERVFERDDFTCRFCGFQAKEYQEVVNLDGNYSNNYLSNLVTACCFCAQCFFIEVVGKGEYGGGTLIYLPEITQNDLNGLCHVLFCAMANATNYRAEAQAIYNGLRLRAKVVEQKFGEGLSDPSLLGRVIINTPVDDPEETGRFALKDVRLLPSRKKFSKLVDKWASSAFEAIT